MTTSILFRSFVSARLVLGVLALPLFVVAVAGCEGDVFTPLETGDPEAPLPSDEGGGGSAAVSGDEQDIVGGKRDYGHPAVVALVVGGNKLCTGTLVGPRTVLTARHCVAPTVEAIQCPPDRSQIGVNVDASSIDVVQGNDVETGTSVARGLAIFAPEGDVVCEADLALVTLDRAVVGTRPLKLSEARIEVGDAVVAVGFGRTSDAGGAGKKRVRRDVAINSFTDEELRVGEASCHGDSGGPLLDAKGRILGVLSRGGPGCSGAVENVYTRPGAAPFSDLLAAALAVPE